MAIGIYFANSGLNADTYKECVKRLKKAGAGHPAGRSYHASFGPPEKLMIFDVWTSKSAFDRFGKTLLPILQQVGANPSPPEVMQINNVIKPPAAGPKKKSSAQRAKPARRHK